MKTLRAIPILAVITFYLVGASVSTGASPGSGPAPSTPFGSARPALDRKPTSVVAECVQSKKATHDANRNEIKNRYNTAVQEINGKALSLENDRNAKALDQYRAQ